MESRRLLGNFKLDHQLWQFIKESSNAIFEVEDWDIYRRAGETVKEEFVSSQQKEYEIDKRSQLIMLITILKDLEGTFFGSFPKHAAKSLADYAAERVHNLLKFAWQRGAYELLSQLFDDLNGLTGQTDQNQLVQEEDYKRYHAIKLKVSKLLEILDQSSLKAILGS